MGKLYEKISRRNKENSTDQEFEVYTSDDFNDKKFRGYSQEVKIMKESDIIKDIKNGADYRTDSTTLVKIGNRNGGEYIHSIPNNSVIDNIQNLPKY